MSGRFAIGVVAIALAGCGGGDGGKEAATGQAPSGAVEAPSAEGTPPGAANGFPPAFLACMSDRGVDVEVPDAVHAPDAQQAFQACLEFLH